MIIKSFVISIAVLLVVNCQNTSELENSQSAHSPANESLEENEFMYWINSYKVYCIGVTPQMCLQIQKSNKIESESWQLFYTSIKGFDWEPGYIYQIIVKENRIPPNQVPADGSDIQYTLVKILDKQRDPAINLHDIWALETLQGKNIDDFRTDERPTMEIKLSMGEVMGTDGCNQYRGKIDQVDGDKLHFSSLSSTRKACRQMELPNLFHIQMELVQRYSLSNLTLSLLDAAGRELMTFRKVD